MARLETDFRKLQAAVLLCTLVVAISGSSFCLACCEIETGVASHALLHDVPHQSAPNCERDICSCCGFQFVGVFAGTDLAWSESVLDSELADPSLPAPQVLIPHRPPRS